MWRTITPSIRLPVRTTRSMATVSLPSFTRNTRALRVQPDRPRERGRATAHATYDGLFACLAPEMVFATQLKVIACTRVGVQCTGHLILFRPLHAIECTDSDRESDRAERLSRPPRRRARPEALRTAPRAGPSRSPKEDQRLVAEDVRRFHEDHEARSSRQRVLPPGRRLLGHGVQHGAARHDPPRVPHGEQHRGTLVLRAHRAFRRAVPPGDQPARVQERRVGREQHRDRARR